VSDRPFRLLPRVTPETEHYWRGGAEGELRILRCRDCRAWLHPPAPVCSGCLSRDLAPEAVSGRGRVHSVTANHQSWNPTMPTPYLIALVELDEDPALRILSNLVDCDEATARIGMPVEVRFEQHDDVWIPLFAPAAGGA
jgi:uncharacterized protein